MVIEMNLIEASRAGNLNKVKELIAAGIDVNVRWVGEWTPLHEACWRDNTEVAKVLVSAGADINARTFNGSTPLHFAIINDYTKIAEYFLLKRHN